MSLKTIKIGEKSYMELNKFAGIMRSSEHRPVSLNEALMKLLEKNSGNDIMRFAGAWKMTDREFGKITGDLEKLWKTWKIEL